MYHCKAPLRSRRRSHQLTRLRSGLAVLASLAAALVGASPAGYAAPLDVQPAHVAPLKLPTALKSGALNNDFTQGLSAGNVTGPRTTATTTSSSTPVVTVQNTLLMEAPFESVTSAWQQVNDLDLIVTNSPVWGVSQSIVPTPAVNIEVPLGFYDATKQPVFPYVVDPDSNAFPPEIGGDHGIYSVQVEDCLPDMQASATGLNQFLDSSSGLPVHCIDPLGNNGTYYVLGSGRTNIYSSTSPKGQQSVLR